MSNIEHQRWNTALSRVAEVERHSRKLRSKFFPRTFTYSKRSAWATEAGFDVLPIDQQHELPAHGEIRSRVRAESVLIGKFDVEAEVRLRAFYPDKALSVRYQTGGERNGITRTVNAHEKVHPYAPELMPTIYDHGTIRNGAGAYLVEDTVTGESATRSQLESLIVPLAQRLGKVHQGVGIRDMHLSRIVGGSYRVRWSNFVETQNVDATIDEAVQRLIDRNDLGSQPDSRGSRKLQYSGQRTDALARHTSKRLNALKGLLKNHLVSPHYDKSTVPVLSRTESVLEANFPINNRPMLRASSHLDYFKAQPNWYDCSCLCHT